MASDDTRRLAAAAVHVLQRIYKPGYDYKKAGVMLTGLQPAEAVQEDLRGMTGSGPGASWARWTA